MLKKMLIVCAAVVFAASPVRAQETDPNAVIDASRQAIADAEGFTAQFKMYGDGSDMIKSTMPSLNGRMTFGEHSEYGRAIRMFGQARDKQDSAPYTMDVLKSRKALVWTDATAMTIDEHPADTKLRKIPTATKLMMFEMLLLDDPFGDRMDKAESIELLAQETIGEELCDVVEITYAKPEPGAGRRRSAQSNHTAARWYISTADHLPRRIDHITDGGMIKFRMITELTDLVLAKPSPEDIDIMRIPGMELNTTLNAPKEPKVKTRRTDPRLQTPGAGRTATRKAPKGARATGYSFADSTGTTINNATQSGRVTVFYFCGSWALPCREVTPMISDLAAELAGQPIDVFGVSVRERDPEAVREAFDAAGYQHRLITDADDLAVKFAVSMFPTIVIVNAEGEVVATHRPKPDQTPADLVDKARKSIDSLPKTTTP